MTPNDRKKIAVIARYAFESFNESDWLALGQITGQLSSITKHHRLLRSLDFGDPDYETCVNEVLNSIFEADECLIAEVIQHFDIDLWYKQKEPARYSRIFDSISQISVDFWTDGYVRLFVSHLSEKKKAMSSLKANLATWGVSAFIAHEDIAASREWRDEVEAGLETMDLLAAVVEPGFKESDWCAQEVGVALGRRVDIIPLCAGMDPFGFFGKYQGIPAKGHNSAWVADEVVQVLLRKPNHRTNLLHAMPKALSGLDSDRKISNLAKLEQWNILTDNQVKELLEVASLSNYEKIKLKAVINRVGAFVTKAPVQLDEFDDDIPF